MHALGDENNNSNNTNTNSFIVATAYLVFYNLLRTLGKWRKNGKIGDTGKMSPR